MKNIKIPKISNTTGSSLLVYNSVSNTTTQLMPLPHSHTFYGLTILVNGDLLVCGGWSILISVCMQYLTAFLKFVKTHGRT